MPVRSLPTRTKADDVPSGRPIIQSLQRGLGILEIIAKKQTGVTPAEISREIGLHASTTFHLLRTLTALGYVSQDPGTKQYYVGSKIFHLASSVSNEVQLLKMANPLLADMAQQTGETSHLAVFERGEVIVVGKIDGESPVGVTERVGYPRPAHCTAIGKVLLASLSDAEFQAFFSSADLRPSTPRTITSRLALEQELARVRTQGYAIDDEEFAQGLRCLAAPVRNFTGTVVAAIGISGPVWRVTLDRVARLTEFVRAASARLSHALGHGTGSRSGNE